jgi:uncharacterized protein (DUF1697 family)
MTETRYIALLRGINVGGNNLIKMSALSDAFTLLKFRSVVTYIQSGNVLFNSSESDIPKLTSVIEKKLSKTFSYTSRVALFTQMHLAEIIDHAPKGFGQQPTLYRYDVMFLIPPLTPKEVLSAMNSIKLRDGVDAVYAGDGVLYFSRLISKASQSSLSKVISLPVFKEITVRNWNTTMALREK